MASANEDGCFKSFGLAQKSAEFALLLHGFHLLNNLNISHYISTAVGEEEIDLKATHGELVAIELAIQAATAKHNGFLKELGLPLLP